MVVKVVNDICVKVLSEGPLRGKFILWPNSGRTDIPMAFSLPRDAKVKDEVWRGRDLK